MDVRFPGIRMRGDTFSVFPLVEPNVLDVSDERGRLQSDSYGPGFYEIVFAAVTGVT